MKDRFHEKRGPTLALTALLALAGAIMALGCTTTGTVGAGGAVVYGYPAIYADVTPYELAGYPRVWYRGSYAYLIDNSWYYPTTAGWVVFRQEPPELYGYRTRYVAPPRYYRAPEYGYPQERPREYRPQPGYPQQSPRYYQPQPGYPQERPRTYQPQPGYPQEHPRQYRPQR